jgi:hypothetical protein
MTKREWVIIAAVVIIGGGAVGYIAYQNNHKDTGISHGSMSMDQRDASGYAVNLTSGKTYASNQPTTLTLSVNKDGKLFKDFGVDSTKLMHLVVVRKDRNYFQHVHPEYDDKTGTFAMSDFTFPTDGTYRVFANFAPKNAGHDAMGMVETEAPYVDVVVGDASKVGKQPLGADSLTSTANGLTAMLVKSASDSGAPTYYAGQDGTLGVSLTKDGAAFKSLQEYLGNLGHMVVLGPNLEFIHAHPMVNDINNQTGYIPFMVTFPKSGQYKLYLQAQANDIVSTFNFNVTVKDRQTSTSGNSSMDDMSGMGH